VVAVDVVAHAVSEIAEVIGLPEGHLLTLSLGVARAVLTRSIDSGHLIAVLPRLSPHFTRWAGRWRLAGHDRQRHQGDQEDRRDDVGSCVRCLILPARVAPGTGKRVYGGWGDIYPSPTSAGSRP
jgi:hypothetical protein